MLVAEAGYVEIEEQTLKDYFDLDTSEMEAGYANTQCGIKTFALVQSKYEVCSGDYCSGYLGYQSRTKTGRICQPWLDNTPHANAYQSAA